MVINLDDTVFCIPNLKSKSWYNEFYGKWILEQYMQYYTRGLAFYVNTLEECIQFQIDNDKMIDDNKFIEDLKYDISGRKEFIIQNNSYQKNKEILEKYKQNLTLLNSKYGEQEPEFIEHINKLIIKCKETLKHGYLVTNQLFLISRWVEDKNYFEEE